MQVNYMLESYISHGEKVKQGGVYEMLRCEGIALNNRMVKEGLSGQVTLSQY